jgi:STE24 endopeptidase
MVAAWATLVVSGALLVGLTVRWVPAVPVAPVTDAGIDSDFTPAEQQRERDFRRQVRPLGLVSVALGVLVPTVLVLTGAAASIADVDGPWWWQVVAVVTVLTLATRAATLPPAVAVRRRTLQVGLATGSWALWWRDVAVATALSWALTCAALVGWVAAARTWPELWWVLVAAAAAVLVLLLSFVLPVLVEPLFARFSPLPDSPLRRRLLDLAERDGVAVRDVLVADASRRTSALNAYVSGLGPTRRIVVHDTLVDRGRDDEAYAVVAHELGHVVAHDVRTGTVLGAVGAVAATAAAAVLLSWSPLLAAASVSGPGDPAVAGLLLALGAWAGLLGAPVQNAVSRRIERRADRHCLDLARDAATVAAMHRSLAVTNVAPLRPPRLLHLWFGTHPTSPERIAAARAWAAQEGVEVPGPLVPASG